ncbi:MAG: tRNA 2-selenouridine(34) synthase MnmH [Candidatus Accumulibacter sp.]|jgi:tRNA 2-selenouridine synthase|nr:tRNA 2-selenouridine(34) synthase MnmH [Accumulibacter sp.]
MRNSLASLADLGDFDGIIDVRTPAEFADDHIPGAENAPVLSNEERAAVGTMYAQVSPFEATRYGAALAARNIAAHLETLFAGQPLHWKPLIYCWRGGKRSAAMTTWFRLIGWRACQLEGGYKTYRRHVLERLAVVPGRFSFRVLTGLTGSGKTRLLRALVRRGAQALDLEDLARHRGSLLGSLPGEAQPGQKSFETRLLQALEGLDPARRVFVEAESRKIGRLQLPDALMRAMSDAECIRVEVAIEDRVAFLCEDYAALFDSPDELKRLLACLAGQHGHRVVGRWHGLIDAGARAELFRELIERHYDPAYRRSSHGLFRGLPRSRPFVFRPNTDELAQAQRLLEEWGEKRPD